MSPKLAVARMCLREEKRWAAQGRWRARDGQKGTVEPIGRGLRHGDRGPNFNVAVELKLTSQVVFIFNLATGRRIASTIWRNRGGLGQGPDSSRG